MASEQHPVETQWLERETELINIVESQIKYYSIAALWSRRWYRVLGVLVLVCSVLAPIAVVSSGSDQNSGPAVVSSESDHNTGLLLFGIQERTVRQLAIVLTVIVALAEGLRRFYNFDLRWSTCVQCRDDLRWLLNKYRDAHIGKQIGAPDWIAVYEKFREDTEKIGRSEAESFFKALTKQPSGS